jgi:hypothetical protein
VTRPSAERARFFHAHRLLAIRGAQRPVDELLALGGRPVVDRAGDRAARGFGVAGHVLGDGFHERRARFGEPELEAAGSRDQVEGARDRFGIVAGQIDHQLVASRRHVAGDASELEPDPDRAHGTVERGGVTEVQREGAAHAVLDDRLILERDLVGGRGAGTAASDERDHAEGPHGHPDEHRAPRSRIKCAGMP